MPNYFLDDLVFKLGPAADCLPQIHHFNSEQTHTNPGQDVIFESLPHSATFQRERTAGIYLSNGNIRSSGD